MPAERGMRMLVGAVTPAVAGLLLVGCAADNRQAAADPLLGPPAPAPAARVAAPAAPTPAPTAQASVVPPLPVPSPPASTSPAALAQGPAASFDPARELRISAGVQTTAGQGGWQSTGSLQPPAGRSDPFSPVSLGAAAGGQVTTHEQALAMLSARGVTWYRLESTSEHGPCKFTCSLPNPQNRLVSRTYEAQAADPLSAMRAVLDQINRDR